MLRRIATGVIVGTLIATSVLPQASIRAAAITGTGQFKPTTFPAVYLTNNSYLKLSSAYVVEAEKGKAFVFTITVYNDSNQTMDLLDYWFRVKNKNGSTYKMKVVDPNVKEVIPAKANRSFTYYAEIDNNTSITDISVDVIKWDFSLPNYERKLSSITIPSSYNNVTPFSQSQQFKWNNQLITTKLNKGVVASDGNVQHVSLTFDINNNGNVPVRLSNTSFYIKTKNGGIYPIDYDPGNDSIAAKSTKQLTFGASLPSNISLEKAVMVWAEKSETVGYALPLVIHEIKTQSEQLQVADVLKLSFNNLQLESKIKQVTAVSVTNVLNRLEVKYELANKGKTNVPLPQLAFEYKSSNDFVYPLEMKETDGKGINPGLNKELELSVELPATETQGKGALYVYEIVKMNDKDVKRLIGKHNAAVSAPVSTSDNAFGKGIDYKSGQSEYKVSVDNIYRSPWNNEDLIQAEIKVSNSNGKGKAAPLLNLTAEIYLDNVIIDVPVDLIKTNNGISIGAGQSIEYLLIAKIPYTQEFSNLKVEIKEKVGEITTKVGTFSGSNAVKQPSLSTIGKTISTARNNKKSELVVQGIKVFEGRNTDMIYVDMGLTNKGIRFDQLSNWVAFFRNKSGMVFPAKMANTADYVNPLGLVNTYAYAIIPKNVGFTDFELLVGEGIIQSAYAGPTETATAFVNPSRISLDYKAPTPATTFDELNLYPYTLNLNNIRTSILSNESFILDFNYRLEQTGTGEKDLTEREVWLEVIDAAGARYEKQLKINEDLLIKGTQKKTIIFEDSNLYVNIPRFGTYTLNLYEVINNHKRLIAEKRMDWFTTSS
ncbi:hypothetical protein [Paenibacillus agaridevorans]|uniref:hypothetical protein n=1 Tax=Paenibacillus agaridevorans TaxID=171404 RepID=UPI001BE45D23|nr:hypothetical protein [Paenibacillus agaridevorans]